MGTLINILLGFLFFMFVATAITVVSAWLVLQFIGTKRERKECCGGNACCKEKVEGLSNPIPTQEACCKDDMSDCTCDEPFIIEDDTIPMLDRPLTKKELKEVNMEEQNKSYNIMSGEDMMNMKTEVGQTASPENLNKSFRGKSYKSKHNRDYINFLDEQERKSKKDYHNEPLEENDPNIHQK